MPTDDIRNDAAAFEDAGRRIYTLQFWMDALKLARLARRRIFGLTEPEQRRGIFCPTQKTGQASPTTLGL